MLTLPKIPPLLRKDMKQAANDLFGPPGQSFSDEAYETYLQRLRDLAAFWRLP